MKIKKCVFNFRMVNTPLYSSDLYSLVGYKSRTICNSYDFGALVITIDNNTY